MNMENILLIEKMLYFS